MHSHTNIYIYIYIYTRVLGFSLIVLLASMWYIRMTAVIAWKKYSVLLLDRVDFSMIDYLSVVLHALTQGMFISLSVDEIVLPRYVDRSANFRTLPLKHRLTPIVIRKTSVCSIEYILKTTPHKPVAVEPLTSPLTKLQISWIGHAGLCQKTS